MTSQKWIILGVAVVLTLAGFLVYVRRQEEPQPTAPSPEPAALQGPSIAPLAKGKQTYTVLTDKQSDFQIIQVDVDPLDVKQGETQTVTVIVKDTKNRPITKENTVQGTVFTDLKATNFTASLAQAGSLPAEASAKEGPGLSMIWQGFWELQDTTDRRYMITVNAANSQSSSKVDLSFR